MPRGNTACLGLPNSGSQTILNWDHGGGGGCWLWKPRRMCFRLVSVLRDALAPRLSPGFDLFPYRSMNQTAGDPGGCVTLPRGCKRNLSPQESLKYPWGSQRVRNEPIHQFCQTLPGQINQTQGLRSNRSIPNPLSGSLSHLLAPERHRGAHATPRHNNSDSNKDNSDKSNNKNTTFLSIKARPALGWFPHFQTPAQHTTFSDLTTRAGR